MARRLSGSCMRRAISVEPFGMNDLRCSMAVVRKINAAFAEKNLYMLDSPVSGGPSGAASGRMAIWVGGDEQIFNRHKSVLDAMGDQAAYIGPIGAGTIAKLVHNCTSAVMGV